ncbi:unnamed protein product, partial [Durusdinium trenchii]
VVDWRRPSCWSFKLFKWSARRNGRIRWDGAVGWSRLWSVLLVPSFFGKNWKGTSSSSLPWHVFLILCWSYT